MKNIPEYMSIIKWFNYTYVNLLRKKHTLMRAICHSNDRPISKQTSSGTKPRLRSSQCIVQAGWSLYHAMVPKQCPTSYTLLKKKTFSAKYSKLHIEKKSWPPYTSRSIVKSHYFNLFDRHDALSQFP